MTSTKSPTAVIFFAPGSEVTKQNGEESSTKTGKKLTNSTKRLRDHRNYGYREVANQMFRLALKTRKTSLETARIPLSIQKTGHV